MNRSARPAVAFDCSPSALIRGQCFGRIVMSPLPATVRREVEMAEAEPAGQGEAGAVLSVPGLEFRGRRLVGGGNIFSQKLHLLGQAALNDDVIFIQAEQ